MFFESHDEIEDLSYSPNFQGPLARDIEKSNILDCFCRSFERNKTKKSSLKTFSN